MRAGLIVADPQERSTAALKVMECYWEGLGKTTRAGGLGQDRGGHSGSDRLQPASWQRRFSPTRLSRFDIQALQAFFDFCDCHR
jgi:hypothetical protein